MSEFARGLASMLASYRYSFSTERELQDGVEQAVRRHGLTFKREHALSARDVIDFMVIDVGIEVKVGGSFAEVARQLHRYAAFDQVGALILLTCKQSHDMPGEINGKPVLVVNVSRGNAF